MSQIRKEMVHGVFWSAVEKYSNLVVSICVTMILARLLSPKEYGVIAIATVIISFLQMFCTMGLGPAIIQRDDLNEKNLNSIFTFSLVVGLLLATLFFLASGLVAEFYGEPLLKPVCRILSIQVFFAAANMVPNALMNKNKKFKDLARRTLALHVLSGSVSIVMAWRGAGVYALLVSPVFSAIGIFIWNRFFYKVNVDFSFDMEPMKRVFSFAFYQFMFDFVNYFSRNLDKIIIGKCMGVNALGVYEKSYRLMQLPLNNISSVINPVLQPVLKTLQNDRVELSLKYQKVVRFVATLSFPIGVFLAGTAYEVIHIFYGARWDNAIPVFRILALSLPLQMILSTSGAICMVCNNTKMQFWLGVRNMMTTVLGFFVAALFFKTIEAVAWAWTLTLLINFFVTYALIYRNVLRVSLLPFVKELIKPLICGFLVFLNLYLVKCFLDGNSIMISMMIKCSSCLGVALIYFQISKQYDFIEIYRKRKRRGENAT